MRGSRSSGSERKRKEKREDDEVEQLLKAAQDEILLNLSLNSHIARASPSNNLHDPDSDPDLDQDLERRFQALKMRNKEDQQKLEPQEHDISARFAALKAKSSSSHSPVDPTGTASKTLTDYYEEDSEEDEEVQVQKLIEWAKDAARLDPSPPSPSPSPSPSDDDDDEDDDHHRKSFK